MNYNIFKNSILNEYKEVEGYNVEVKIISKSNPDGKYIFSFAGESEVVNIFFNYKSNINKSVSVMFDDLLSYVTIIVGHKGYELKNDGWKDEHIETQEDQYETTYKINNTGANDIFGDTNYLLSEILGTLADAEASKTVRTKRTGDNEKQCRILESLAEELKKQNDFKVFTAAELAVSDIATSRQKKISDELNVRLLKRNSTRALMTAYVKTSFIDIVVAKNDFDDFEMPELCKSIVKKTNEKHYRVEGSDLDECCQKTIFIMNRMMVYMKHKSDV